MLNKLRKNRLILIIVSIILLFSTSLFAYEFNIDGLKKALQDALHTFAWSSGFHAMLAIAAAVLLIIKNGILMFCDFLYDKTQSFLYLLWNFTEVKNGPSDLGVGSVANVINNELTALFVGITGIMIYFFGMLTGFTALSRNENPFKAVRMAFWAVGLLIAYPLIYSFIIIGTTKLAATISAFSSPVLGNVRKISDLTLSLLSSWTETVNAPPQILEALQVNVDYMKIFKDQTTGYGDVVFNPMFWMGLVAQLILSLLAVIYLIQIFFMKGMQIVTVLLAYFTGFIAIVNFAAGNTDTFKKWIMNFFNACMYSFYWALLILVIKIISAADFALPTNNISGKAIIAILQMFAVYGGFHMMVKVSNVAETLSGNAGIATNAGKEFQQNLNSAGGLTKTLGTAVAVGAALSTGAGAGLAASATSGTIPKNMNLPKFDMGKSSGGGGGKGGGGFMGGAKGFYNKMADGFNAGIQGGGHVGEVGHSLARESIDYSKQQLAAIKQFASKLGGGPQSPTGGMSSKGGGPNRLG